MGWNKTKQKLKDAKQWFMVKGKDGKDTLDTKKVVGATLLGATALVGGGYAANELLKDKRTFTEKHTGKLAAGVIGTGLAAGAGYYAYKNGMLPFGNGDDETASGESTLDNSTSRKSGSSSKKGGKGAAANGVEPKAGGSGLLIGIAVIVLAVIAFFVMSGGDEEESAAPMGDDLV